VLARGLRWNGCMGTAAAIIVGVVVVGACGPVARAPALPELAKPVEDATFLERTAMLRATLVRNAIELDTDPMIDTCLIPDEKPNCMRCDLATGMDGIDPDLIDRVAIAIASYPETLLAAAEIKSLALCRRIRYLASSEDGPGGVAQTDKQRLMVSVESFMTEDAREWAIEQIVHHEIFHLFDSVQLGNTLMRSDPDWGELKPPGFEYRDPAVGTSRPNGFVNIYATTDEGEDRASTYEYLITRADELCGLAKTDPILEAKVEVVWRRVAAAGGEPFLRKHAPCVSWVKAPKAESRRKRRK
jgi:hypothetical protein